MYLTRKLYSRWIKITHYEFWPTAVFYAPGIIYYLWCCLKNRHLGLLSVANPGMLKVGIFQAPKAEVLKQLGKKHPEHILQSLTLAAKERNNWVELSYKFIKQHSLKFPIIVKPQIGQRGADIKLTHSQAELAAALNAIPKDALYMLQEFAPGIEYGVHYARLPNKEDGWIFSLGRKDSIYLQGDGVNNLQHLIMHHPRACIMYKVHLAKHQDKLGWVPAKDEKFKLVEIGTHSRGAIFNDSRELITAELTKQIDALSKGYPGFFIGRYDILALSQQDLQAGRNFKVVELNSVMGEPPHMYDPDNSLWQGYVALFQYIKLVVTIAKENIALGNHPLGWRDFIRTTGASYKQLT